MFGATTRLPRRMGRGPATRSSSRLQNFTPVISPILCSLLPGCPSLQTHLETFPSREWFFWSISFPGKCLLLPSSGLLGRLLCISLGCDCLLDNMIFPLLSSGHTKTLVFSFSFCMVDQLWETRALKSLWPGSCHNFSCWRDNCAATQFLTLPYTRARGFKAQTVTLSN